ncbi:MAG: DUF6326 family protein [Cyclobacteriaceae bacterium]
MLENARVNIRVRLSALWTSVIFCYLYADYFELYVPGKADSLLTGEHILDTPVKLLSASIVLAIPCLLIALTVLLPATICRFLNILFGLLFTFMMLFIGINSITEWYGFYVLYAFLESMLTIIIIWQAWRWPKADT